MIITLKKRKVTHIVLLKVPANNIVADQAINTSLGQYNCNIINFIKIANELTKIFLTNKLITLKVCIYENGDFIISIKNVIFMSLVKTLLFNKQINEGVNESENIKPSNILTLKEVIFIIFLKYKNLDFYTVLKNKNQKFLFKSFILSFLGSLKSSNNQLKIIK